MKLTERQRLYAEARFAGLHIKEAAIAAGCPEKTAHVQGSRLERHEKVQVYIHHLKERESASVPGAGRDAPPAGAGGMTEPFFEDPKEMLRYAMNNSRLDMKTRIQAATALLPYEHKKLGETGKKEGQQDAAEEVVVSGRFAPAKPPARLQQLTLVR